MMKNICKTALVFEKYDIPILMDDAIINYISDSK